MELDAVAGVYIGGTSAAGGIASVQDADLIIVMDNGGVSATGTHDELLKTSEIYREVYEQQTNGGDSSEAN